MNHIFTVRNTGIDENLMRLLAQVVAHDLARLVAHEKKAVDVGQFEILFVDVKRFA